MSEAGAVEWAVLARVIRPQGRKGEVLADLLTDFPKALPGRKGLRLGQEDGPENARPCLVTAAWLPKGKNEGRVVLAIEGIATISDAETLTGLCVLVRREERLTLPDDSVYVSDLEGAAVWNGGRRIGVIREVRFPADATGRRLEDAAPLLVIVPEGSSDGEQDEVLVPFVKDFLVRVDHGERAVRMQLPEGLTELAR